MDKGDRSIDYAEERRLFYVAMTRTKNRVFVVAPEQNPSEFLLEIKNDYKNVRLEGEWNEDYVSNTTKKACPLCGYPMQFKYKKAYGLRLYICSNEPEVCGFMTNDIHGGKMAIQKCEKYRDGYLIVKHSQKHGYFLGCTNYAKNGSGCDKSIGMKYYYDQIHYTMDDSGKSASGTGDYSTKMEYPKVASRPDNTPIIKEPASDYVDIQRADIEPVYYCDRDLNDVIFTVLKALQYASKQRFYSENVLTDIICGTESEKVVKNKLGQIPEFRALNAMPYDTVQAIIEWMISEHFILKTKERYPVLHSTYDGLHYSEFITKGKLQKLKQYLEEDVILWK